MVLKAKKSHNWNIEQTANLNSTTFDKSLNENEIQFKFFPVLQSDSAAMAAEIIFDKNLLKRFSFY